MTVGSTDIERSEAFYRTPGLTLIVKNDRYLRFECPDGEGTFSVDLVDDVPDEEQVTVYFESDNLDGELDPTATDSVSFTPATIDGIRFGVSHRPDRSPSSSSHLSPGGALVGGGEAFLGQGGDDTDGRPVACARPATAPRTHSSSSVRTSPMILVVS
ncbi:MAG TPA: hypothetical protein VNC61_16490 [Acidimicrobiales bacterium]|nr:hypothetical protein [Acidimicrobiales bacterium]